MTRPPFYEVPPTPALVRRAWAKARPGQSLYQRRFSFAQRAFLQGVVSEHLRQTAERKRNPARAKLLYRPLSAAERRAIEVTRAWLEFGDPLIDDFEADGGASQ